MLIILLRLMLAPALVYGISRATHRWGPIVGGWLAGMPAVAGPILLVTALSHGIPFTALASGHALIGIVAFVVYVLTFALASAYLRASPSLLLGWIAFLLAGYALNRLPLTLALQALLAIAACALAPFLLRKAHGPMRIGGISQLETWARVGFAFVLVVLITGVSGRVGPEFTGILAPFPIASSVLAWFSLRQGRDNCLHQLRGLLGGVWSLTVFFITLAITLPRWGGVPGFVAALSAALCTAGIVLFILRRQARS